MYRITWARSGQFPKSPCVGKQDAAEQTESALLKEGETLARSFGDGLLAVSAWEGEHLLARWTYDDCAERVVREAIALSS